MTVKCRNRQHVCLFLVFSAKGFSKIPGICLAHIGNISFASIFVFDSSWLDIKKDIPKDLEILIKGIICITALDMLM